MARTGTAGPSGRERGAGRRWRVAGAVGALTVTVMGLLAACSSSTDSTSTTAVYGTPSTTGASASTSSAPTASTVAGNLAGEGATPKLEMELDDNYFGPDTITVAPGAVVTVELANEGSRPHTFTTDNGVDQLVAPDQKAEVKVTMPASGTLAFHCRFHGAGGMTGKFTIAGAATTPAASTSTSLGGGY
jgi:plastocyanin